MSEKSDRRGFLGKTVLGAAGIGAAYSLEERILLAAVQNGAEKGPSRRRPPRGSRWLAARSARSRSAVCSWAAI